MKYRIISEVSNHRGLIYYIKFKKFGLWWTAGSIHGYLTYDNAMEQLNKIIDAKICNRGKSIKIVREFNC